MLFIVCNCLHVKTVCSFTRGKKVTFGSNEDDDDKFDLKLTACLLSTRYLVPFLTFAHP